MNAPAAPRHVVLTKTDRDELAAVVMRYVVEYATADAGNPDAYAEADIAFEQAIRPFVGCEPSDIVESITILPYRIGNVAIVRVVTIRADQRLKHTAGTDGTLVRHYD